MSEEQRPFVPKTPIDFQKMKLERLMANPNKPVVIPETPKEKKGLSVPEFVRNVMGSSAGAGSGEFHVYRHLRRKEYTRLKIIEEKGEKERLDDDYQKRIEDNKRKMEEKTAKRRAKRLKKKQKQKNKKTIKKSPNTQKKCEEKSSSSSEDDTIEKPSDQSDSDKEKNVDDALIELVKEVSDGIRADASVEAS